MQKANNKEDYNDLADEIDHQRDLKRQAMTQNVEREGLKQRIAEMKKYLQEQSEQVLEFDEVLVRRFVEKVQVLDNGFVVEFKSGTSVDVGR